MPKTVRLSNATDISEEYKLRQNPPNYQQIAELTPEDYTKLKSRGEYFWVKVDAVEPFVGIVMEDPVFQQKFEKGDKIYFEDYNIYDLRSKGWLTNEGI
jgi:hypothetical protein